MMDQPPCWPLGGDGAKERLRYQARGHPLGHGVADQFAVEQILDAGKIEPALVGGDVGDIADPGAIGGRHGELPIEKIGRQWQGMPRIRRSLEFPLLLAAQPEFPAYPLDAIEARLDAVIGQVGPQAPGTLGFTRPLMRGLDLGFQPEVLLLTS